MKKNIIILDINSHIHRAYHTARGPKIRDHEKEGAYFEGRPNYMVTRAINIIEDEIKKIEKANRANADYIACVLDHDGKNFRHDLYPEYKATRPPTDKEFNYMRNCIYKLISLKGYYTMRVEGVEADDVIGTLAQKSENAGLSVTIGSDDKDFFQQVSGNIKVFRGKLNKMYGVDEVVESKGVPPSKVLDYLAMDGDKVDNVIGIPNCGTVTCVKILENHTLDEILDKPNLLTEIDGLRGKDKLIAYIEENKDFIKLMKEVVSLKNDMDLGLFLKDLVKRKEDKPKIETALRSIGLKR